MAPQNGSTTIPDRPNGTADVTSYPILTEHVNFPSAPATATPASPTGALGGTISLQQMVDGAMRDVLGWRPKTADNKGFLTALNQSFDLQQVEGHVEWKWNQRSYAGQVETDLGAVTGAQASIYTRAKVALDQSLPLLSGLYQLTIDVAQEDIESIRSIVRSELIELVNEFGIVGGPRVFLVNNLFRLLIGDYQPEFNAQKARNGKPPELNLPPCNLKILRDRLGLTRNMVNSLEDEQNYTNFLILVDYIVSLKQSWESYQPFFNRDSSVEPYLGTQLVLFSRALTAVGEAVQDVYFTMDSVFLGPGERQTLDLQFAGKELQKLPAILGDPSTPGGTPGSYLFRQAPMYVSELMDSVTQTVQQVTDLVQDSGKDGVIASFPTLIELRKLVRGSLDKRHGGVQSQDGFPAGYFTDRVQRAILELADELDKAAQLAGKITSKAEIARANIQDAPGVGALQEVLNQLRDNPNPSGQDVLNAIQHAVSLLDGN